MYFIEWFIGLLLFINSPDSTKKLNAQYAGIAQNSRLQILHPEVPQQVSFAGEQVPISDTDVKERLEREIIQNCYKHSATLLILKRELRWKKKIQEILREQGIPEDFFYLAVAESELDEYAVSGVGAMGFWQFMKGTAGDFKLEVNEFIDQRKDPIASTYAACQYLKTAYNKYGNNWTLAAASYNRGMNGIQKAIEQQQVNSYYDLYLNRETYRYVFRIIALKIIMENPEKYGFIISEKDRWQPLDYYTVKVDTTINSLPAFAKKYNITYKTLKIYNPWLDSENYNLPAKGKTYHLNIPKQ